ncbi:hydrogenase [Rhodoferax koreense]|uniref:Hydrogenase n=1 Tax=Rhodoferax koreensis TaxID=1842727 RepID=A0A1P8JY36_9BURK|nr:3-hydroxybutyrate oligomer hydrolase family protein [Rhodoferax koreense]APW38673.1 hydrogenase [Rhodoferax koreense]
MGRGIASGTISAGGAAALALLATAGLTGCGGGSDGPGVNTLPGNVSQLSRVAYRATATGSGSTAATQDLLTAGLGKSGLASTAAVPAYADPLNPTAEELRRNAIQSNYRGLVDATAGGGYGVLFGPNIDLSGANTRGEGLVPGLEYLGVLDDSAGRKRVAMVVQIPDSFDVNAPCVVVGPSSGSRGVYGAISSAGEWGLKRGCAVALTDAGKGMGLYDPGDDTVHRIDGTRATRAAAGSLAHFAANLTDTVRSAFNAAFPNRLALKHAHSQLNPEKDWGNDTLAAARYALYALNQEYGDVDGNNRRVKFNAGNTTIIAASVSNGGAAVLRAAEQDSDGLIDGVVAFEPSAQPSTTAGYGVQFGGTAVPGYGKPLIDYFTVANLYQPCAALASAALMTETSTFNYIPLVAMTARATNRCAALAARGLVAGATTADQANDALARLRAYGWSTANDQMHNAHYGLGNAVIISTMYVNAYGRFSVADNVCGMSLAAVNASGAPVAVAAATRAQSYALGNGTANGSPATPVLNTAVGGATGWTLAVSPGSGTADFALDGALCQRALVTGVDTVSGAALTATSVPTKAQSDAVRAGMAEVLLNGNLRGKPVLMVGGRSDALIPVNNSERAYAAYNRVVEGGTSQLRYIEVTNAQHFDAFNPFSGFDSRFVPLHAYFTQAMNAMYARLKSGTALPPSQVVRTTPRGGTPGAAPAITAANVPAISGTPATADQIGFAGTSINVPQ